MLTTHFIKHNFLIKNSQIKTTLLLQFFFKKNWIHFTFFKITYFKLTFFKNNYIFFFSFFKNNFKNNKLNYNLILTSFKNNFSNNFFKNYYFINNYLHSYTNFFKKINLKNASNFFFLLLSIKCLILYSNTINFNKISKTNTLKNILFFLNFNVKLL